MAVDMFLELEGIKGETSDKAFKSKNAMDLLAWSWGLSNTGTFHQGTGGGAGSTGLVLPGPGRIRAIRLRVGYEHSRGVVSCRRPRGGSCRGTKRGAPAAGGSQATDLPCATSHGHRRLGPGRQSARRRCRT